MRFSNDDHLLALREEIHDKHKKWDDVNDSKLKELVTDLNSTNHRLILHTKNTGDWMKLRVTTVTDTVLSAKLFCDFNAHTMMLPPLIFR